jgi:hypothetical protein
MPISLVFHAIVCLIELQKFIQWFHKTEDICKDLQNTQSETAMEYTW